MNHTPFVDNQKNLGANRVNGFSPKLSCHPRTHQHNRPFPSINCLSSSLACPWQLHMPCILHHLETRGALIAFSCQQWCILFVVRARHTHNHTMRVKGLPLTLHTWVAYSSKAVRHVHAGSDSEVMTFKTAFPINVLNLSTPHIPLTSLLLKHRILVDIEDPRKLCASHCPAQRSDMRINEKHTFLFAMMHYGIKSSCTAEHAGCAFQASAASRRCMPAHTMHIRHAKSHQRAMPTTMEHHTLKWRQNGPVWAVFYFVLPKLIEGASSNYFCTLQYCFLTLGRARLYVIFSGEQWLNVHCIFWECVFSLSSDQ